MWTLGNNNVLRMRVRGHKNFGEDEAALTNYEIEFWD